MQTGLRASLSSFFNSFFLSLLFLSTMSANGVVRAALAPGHFLFTSESVGEGHPGANEFKISVNLFFNPKRVLLQTKSAIKCLMPL